MYTASALAANTVLRSAAGAAAPLFTTYMFDALGVGGGGSLIGGVAVLLAPIPFVFYRYGAPIRKRSKFAPTEHDNDGEKEKQRGSRNQEPQNGGVRQNSNASSDTATGDELTSHEDVIANGESGSHSEANLDDTPVGDPEKLTEIPQGEDDQRDLEKGIFEHKNSS